MSTSYCPVARTLRRLMIVLIIGLLALGLYMQEMPLSPEKLELYSWHKWLGVTVFMLAWPRLAWRAANPAPSPPVGPPPYSHVD